VRTPVASFKPSTSFNGKTRSATLTTSPISRDRNPEGQNPVYGRPIRGRSMGTQRIGTEFHVVDQDAELSHHGCERPRESTPLKTTVSPGHPLCKGVFGVPPRGDTRRGPPRRRTRLPTMQRRARPTPLAANSASVYPMLRGIIAGEQRNGIVPSPRRRADRAASKRSCVRSAARRLAAGEGEMVKCTFCNITGARTRKARAPAGRAKGEPPPMEPFWVLLDGYSSGRKKLLAGKKEGRRRRRWMTTTMMTTTTSVIRTRFGGGPPGLRTSGRPRRCGPPRGRIPTCNAMHSRRDTGRSRLAPLIIGIAVGVVVLLAACGIGGAIYVQVASTTIRPPKSRAAKEVSVVSERSH